MKEITCNCEHVFKSEIPDEIDLSKEPGIITQITDGTFMNVTCPSCHTVLKPEFPVRLFNRKKNWDIQFVPELARREFLKGLKSGKPEESSRFVIGYLELMEKIKCLSDGLDDRVIEYLKYHIFSKVLEKTQSDETEIILYYNETKENELIFHIRGLKQDEVALFKISCASYEKALSEIKKHMAEEPFSEFLVPPYVSLNKLYTWSD
jgi:hypothetical protein